ncbi:uncharacterized protein LOC133909666 isoform X2 [Phragmites australis]|uniref:uncharacterized protein LOC133909666 isoform X2 n=1 Tax=Phragmites australis TaxID=29695 RepID=UPI002D780EDE|nr:uncharacterized protein LOC133909666 isoform X2 [Phragmites australis]
MRKIKRGGDDLTRSSHKNRRACNGGGEITESSISGDLHWDSNQDVWTRLSDEIKSNLSKSVASLALCNGDTVVFACSGIAIERQGYVTRFMTSASLVRVFNDTRKGHDPRKKKEKRKGHDSLKIEVRHEGDEVYEGFLAEYSLDSNFAVVDVRTFLDVHVGLIEHAVEILPRGKVVAVGRGISGKLMATSVILTDDLSGSEINEDFISSTCKISEAWEGGPLFSFDGNFVGMNICLVMERAFFLPWGTILERLDHFWTSLQKKTGLPQSKSLKGVRFGARPIDETSNCNPEVYRDVVNKEQFEDLDSMGYPKLPITMLHDGMILVHTFEETFGDICGEGVWSELSKKASSNIRRSVVAIASFNGEKRFFACTGFFIEWNGSTAILTSASLVRNSGDENKIDENLRIEVLLPNKQHREGTLQHYSLHYNVALVSVKDFRALRPANIQLQWNNSSKVAAVGRCFKSGALMAASGWLVSWSGTLDCKFIVRSSCKITKAGIGGPLVNLDGEVIGMNFYDRKVGTPFLLWKEIRNILSYFEEKSKAAVGNDSDPSGAHFWKMAGDHRVRLNRYSDRTMNSHPASAAS